MEASYSCRGLNSSLCTAGLSEVVGAVRAHIGVDMLGEDQANHFKFRRRRLGLSFFQRVCLLVCPQLPVVAYKMSLTS